LSNKSQKNLKNLLYPQKKTLKLKKYPLNLKYRLSISKRPPKSQKNFFVIILPNLVILHNFKIHYITLRFGCGLQVCDCMNLITWIFSNTTEVQFTHSNTKGKLLEKSRCPINSQTISKISRKISN